MTSSPADITAYRDGDTHYFEVKFTRREESYFGAATLTEWEAAIRHPDNYWFVVAFKRAGEWRFHRYTPAEFMAFSSIPPFKVFFHIPIGESKSEPSRPGTRGVRLTRDRLADMAALYQRWRGGE